MPHLVSVNLGQPSEIPAANRTVVTSIFKAPTNAPVAVQRHNLAGDRQADLRVHGGIYKAVYAYPSEHYAYWANEYPQLELPFGAFGENLTTAGLLEESVAIGDRFRIGSAVLEITQPRMPCFKLSLRLGRSDIVKKFWHSGRSGFYFAVLQEGELVVGDAIEKLTNASAEVITIADVIGLYQGEIQDPAIFERALRSPLRGSWKSDIRERWEARSLPLF